MEASLSETEAKLLQTEAKKTKNVAMMREIGIPAVTLKKYVMRGYDDPAVFLHANPAGVRLATGVSLGTIYSHQLMAARYLKRPEPKKLTATEFEKETKSLTELGMDAEVLARLAAAGAFTALRLAKADPEMLAAETGVPESEIRTLQRHARKVCAQ